MDISFSPAENAFREEVRTFIVRELPDAVRRKMMEGRSLQKAEIVGWQRKLNARRWATPSWPGPPWH